jgi:hypothetical protein
MAVATCPGAVVAYQSNDKEVKTMPEALLVKYQKHCEHCGKLFSDLSLATLHCKVCRGEKKMVQRLKIFMVEKSTFIAYQKLWKNFRENDFTRTQIKKTLALGQTMSYQHLRKLRRAGWLTEMNKREFRLTNPIEIFNNME